MNAAQSHLPLRHDDASHTTLWRAARETRGDGTPRPVSAPREAIAALVRAAIQATRPDLVPVPEDVPGSVGRAVRHFASLLSRAVRAALDEHLTRQVVEGAAAWFDALWREMAEGAGVAGADRTENTDLSRERALRLVAVPLADHLNAVLPELRSRSDEARRVLGEPIEWELFEQERRPIDWSILSRADALAAADTGLRRRCHAIVNRLPEPVTAPHVHRRVVTERRQRLVDVGYGVVTGTTRGNRVSDISGAELALFATGEADEIFFTRIAEGDLTVLEHRRGEIAREERNVVDHVESSDPLAPGHVFVCIDTSGSMRGIPEHAARAAALAIARYARRAARLVTLIAFQDGVSQVVIPPPGSPPAFGEALLARLCGFLGAPFAGGADLTPPLDAAIPAIEADQTRRHDLVVISDLAVPKFTPGQTARLRALQARGRVTLHAITTGRSPLSDPFHLFDTTLHYDTTPQPDGGDTAIGTAARPLPRGHRRRGR